MSHVDCDKEYKRHLQVFFQYIFNNGDINANCPQISSSARNIFSKLKSYRDDANWSLSIEPPWIISIENDRNFHNRSALLVIGGKIRVADSRFTLYSLSTCIVIDPETRYMREERTRTGEIESCCGIVAECPPLSRVARRFHFDIHTESGDGVKPICHMQYGGRAGELDLHTFHYCLDPWLEKPRFPYPPVDIPLLFDLLLRQFGTSLSEKFVDEIYWRNLVKKSERFLLEKYYNQITQYFNRDSDVTLYERLCGLSRSWT